MTRRPWISFTLVLVSAGIGHPVDARAQAAASASTVVDPRDGRTYRVVEIGDRLWFAQNLAFASERSLCFDDRQDHCERYGRLYRWEDALSACPPGWHMSTEYEWQEMEQSLGLPFAELGGRGNRGSDEGAMLKPGGVTGFDAQMGGWYDPDEGSFRAAGENAALWTATEAHLEAAWHRDIDVGDDMIFRSRVTKTFALSVRCVMDWATGR